METETACNTTESPNFSDVSNGKGTTKENPRQLQILNVRNVHTFPALKVDRNSKTAITISRPFSMIS